MLRIRVRTVASAFLITSAAASTVNARWDSGDLPVAVGPHSSPFFLAE